MALAHDSRKTRRTRSPAVSLPGSGPAENPPRAPGKEAERAIALRRVVAEISASLELDEVFGDVLDSSRTLFSADAAALWLLTPGRHPLKLAAQHDLPDDLVAAVEAATRDDPSLGLKAVQEQRTIVLDRPDMIPCFSEIYAREGYRVANHVPLVFRDEALGLLVLYHRTAYDWTPDELELCTTFASQMAIAVANARLFNSVREGAARLRAIQELSSRLNRIQEMEGIGAAIVAEADQLIGHDTIRVYRVDHVTQVCEPIAFQGEFVGMGTPAMEDLRIRIGDGLTGWVALHNTTIRIGDAMSDPRGRLIGANRGPESMLLVPMPYESRVLGVIVLSKAGYDQYTEDDQRTLEIFAGYAAQALVNAEAFGQVRRQQQELSHRLESQRRLLEVNERLLSTLDPSGVLEMIADSLKAVMAYDSLTIYRVDRTAWVRRAVVARDRFAEMILSHESPLDAGITGWVIRNREAVLANDAHLDPRVEQIPGTPEEPESMIVCPLLVGGEVIGTLNMARMGGEESHFSRDEFELVQLFAAQASIALRNAEAHGAVVLQAENDSLTGLRNHGAFQRQLDELIERGDAFALLMLDLDAFKTYNDTHGHPAGDALLHRVADAMRESIRGDDRVYRYGGDEFSILVPRADGPGARELAERVRSAVARLTQTFGPQVTVSVGIAHHPEDGQEKDELVAHADRALYLAKPPSRSRQPTDDPTRDLYLAAVDQTTLKLLERLEPRELLAEILERAANLVGVKHGFLYLLEGPDEAAGGDLDLVARVGMGYFEDYDGYRLPHGAGVGWAVVRSGRPVVVDDYDEYPSRVPDLPVGQFGAVCAVPLTSGDEVLGLIGLASGDATRPFSVREVEALARFGQLASIAIDNARLFERAQTEVRSRAHAALHDTLTGLPNRTMLLNRLAEQMDSATREEGRRRVTQSRVALILLDLDRFKVVNESLGHAAGDLLLTEVGKRLLAAARSTDTVARLGSDEFGVLLGPVRSVREAERVAARIEASLAGVFVLEGSEVSVGASMGIAIGSAGLPHPFDLLKQAEIALHRAKADPIRNVILFDPEMHVQALDRVALEHDLRGAIERSELRLHYQPLVELLTGEVLGMEALLRWEHPTRGLISPLSFIPLAEETGLILPIGRWVLETACHQLRDWQRRFPAASGLAISVNLSARQFAESSLISNVATILDHAGLEPGLLELEITESVVMDQSEASIERLRALRALGVRLVLDDFGTGYSSLSYLRRLPLDTIKIDRSFVSGLGGEDPADGTIVQAVIALAHGLGIDVVAEGIETATQLTSLRDLACDRGQGYFFARPLPDLTMEALLAASTGDRVVLGTTR
ncbi:MAG TPA: EAL domain-containing protein [Candidatus Limnocylindrales bacterium]|nr:EAL domain-containing protein [Candidatus Limnocylindrales bacterium]